MIHCRPLLIATAVTLGAGCVQADTGTEKTKDHIHEYRAVLRAVNPEYVAGGGRFEIVREGDEVHVAMTVENLTPDMMHQQHLHGSRDGMGASCPPLSRDALDGHPVDLAESRRHSGITLVPLHDDPVSLKIDTDTYPTADDTGGYTYSQTFSWKALQKAVEDKYGLKDLELGDLVMYVHGVPADTDLPAMAESLEGVPAHMTLPVACGEVEEWEPEEGAGLIER